MKRPFLYIIIRPIIRLWFLIFYRPIFINKEVIPKKGKIILAGTHTSGLDFAPVGSSTKRVVRFLVKDELTNGFFGFLFKACGVIPINRNIKDDTVIPNAIKALEEESIICIFPEGTVNKTKDLIMPFKKGAVKIAIDSNSPIIPFAITGKYTLFKKSVKITFGDLYYPKTKDIVKENKILENKVKTLIKNNYK